MARAKSAGFPEDPTAWWAGHLDELTRHEQSLYAYQERRAQLLGGVTAGLVTAGITAVDQADTWWGALGWMTRGAVLLGILALVGATALFWMVSTPMPGRRFPAGSAAAWVYEQIAGGSRAHPDLGRRYAGAPPEAKPGVLAEWLKGAVGTDLTAWLAVDDDEAREVRVRAVFWLWANREVRVAKAELVAVGMRWMTAGVGLLFLAALGHALGLWALILVIVVAALRGPLAEALFRT